MQVKSIAECFKGTFIKLPFVIKILHILHMVKKNYFNSKFIKKNPKKIGLILICNTNCLPIFFSMIKKN